MHHREEQFETILFKHGFQHESGWSYHGSRYVALNGDVKKYVSWYGGPYLAGEVFLGIGDIPFHWPVRQRVSREKTWRTAKSPLIHMSTKLSVTKQRDQKQIDTIVDWLEDVGFLWLAEPTLFSDGDWAKKLLYMPETWDAFFPHAQLNQTENAG